MAKHFPDNARKKFTISANYFLRDHFILKYCNNIFLVKIRQTANFIYFKQ